MPEFDKATWKTENVLVKQKSLPLAVKSTYSYKWVLRDDRRKSFLGDDKQSITAIAAPPHH